VNNTTLFPFRIYTDQISCIGAAVRGSNAQKKEYVLLTFVTTNTPLEHFFLSIC